jgi:hypothetical protein
MAITPKDAGRLLTADAQKVEALEKQIDRALLKGDETFDIMGNPGDKVLDEIIGRYEKAGWDVKLEHDQREGDWLSFTAR